MEFDYRPNSHKAKTEEKKKVEKVVNGTAKVKKKGELSKLTNMIVQEDVSNVGAFVFSDILIPAVKKVISDVVTNSIDMLLFGEKGRTERRSSNGVSYRNYNSISKRDDDRRYESRARSYSYDDIILESHAEAEEVLSQMDGLIATYGVVSVADLYDLVGITRNYTDNKYGWTNLHNAEAIRVRDGYMLKLPKALPLD